MKRVIGTSFLAGTSVAQLGSKGRLREVLAIGEERGLLLGSRTHVLRGRMPVGLVEQAKLKSGI
jgi:hypothetical protein